MPVNKKDSMQIIYKDNTTITGIRIFIVAVSILVILLVILK